jgi:hypothetical protein
MIFHFYGFETGEIDNIIVDIIDVLNLGHQVYSTVLMPPYTLYNARGTYVSEGGRAISIPPFQGLRDSAQETVRQVSQHIGNDIVIMTEASGGVFAARNGTNL